MTNATMAPAVNEHANPHHTRRWWVLAVLAVAQLMVVLDATVVNIALPHAQTALHFSNADRQWVVTAYSLAFGSLLLLGGRLADILGRKRLFLTGVIGFGPWRQPTVFGWRSRPWRRSRGGGAHDTRRAASRCSASRARSGRG